MELTLTLANDTCDVKRCCFCQLVQCASPLSQATQTVIRLIYSSIFKRKQLLKGENAGYIVRLDRQPLSVTRIDIANIAR